MNEPTLEECSDQFKQYAEMVHHLMKEHEAAMDACRHLRKRNAALLEALEFIRGDLEKHERCNGHIIGTSCHCAHEAIIKEKGEGQ